MTRRVCIGDRFGTPGLFVACPGFDALTDDLNDPTKIAFSSTWGETLGFALAGEVQTGVWVTLPAAVGYYPAIFWDIRTGTAAYKANEVLNVSKSAGSYWIAITPIALGFQNVSGVRSFQFSSTVGVRTVRYAVTSYKVAA